MREREEDVAGVGIRAREKAANPIPRSSPTVVMAEGGEKTQPGPGRKASEIGLQAFLRLIKDIRGRLARYSARRMLTEARNHHRVSYRRKWMKESSSFDLPQTLLP